MSKSNGDLLIFAYDKIFIYKKINTIMKYLKKFENHTEYEGARQN